MCFGSEDGGDDEDGRDGTPVVNKRVNATSSRCFLVTPDEVVVDDNNNCCCDKLEGFLEVAFKVIGGEDFDEADLDVDERRVGVRDVSEDLVLLLLLLLLLLLFIVVFVFGDDDDEFLFLPPFTLISYISSTVRSPMNRFSLL